LCVRDSGAAWGKSVATAFLKQAFFLIQQELTDRSFIWSRQCIPSSKKAKEFFNQTFGMVQNYQKAAYFERIDGQSKLVPGSNPSFHVRVRAWCGVEIFVFGKGDAGQLPK
jgi:hypothetical protein